MIEFGIPGGTTMILRHLVADFNGTLAAGGSLLPGVAERIEELAGRVSISVVTADTFGRARNELARLPVELVVLAGGDQDEQKAHHVRGLGPETTVAVGNGRNDRLMLQQAVLGLAVLNAEGVAMAAVEAADVLFRDICDALDALLDPRRMVATLRR